MSLVRIRDLGRRPYQEIWYAMREFTERRVSGVTDEIWMVEHDPIYTLGQAGKLEHVLRTCDIPVIKTDRGGQVTYHGPGQVVFYFLLDVRRLGGRPRTLVSVLERGVIKMLAHHKIVALAHKDAPGVYVQGAKIAALGLRLKRMYSYHGVSFNVNMDLSPFSCINPCGYPNLPVTQFVDWCSTLSWHSARWFLLSCFVEELGYKRIVM